MASTAPQPSRATRTWCSRHPTLGHPLDRSKLLKRFKAAVKRAEVGQFKEVVKDGKKDRRPLTRFHDLRHTFGTRMAAAGVPMRTLQEWMGHRDLKTTLIYADYARACTRPRGLTGHSTATLRIRTVSRHA